MKKITEDFLHFLWKNQHLTGVILTCEEGIEIEVLDPGMHNHDSGPDFFNSKIRIDGTTWAGNVEIHINASDWMRHNHHTDPAFDSIILHVVCFNDCTITRRNKQPIVTALISFPSILWDKYNILMQRNNSVPCNNSLTEINTIYRTQWISGLLAEKLSEKHTALEPVFREVSSHWDSLLNRIIFRSFGSPVNSLPFEMLASGIPYNYLLRLKDDTFQLEALLFGESGMLNVLLPNDIYMEHLRREYRGHKLKLSNGGMPEGIWKFMRMRPSSFPTLRIAQLASFIHSNYPLREMLTTCPTAKELKKHFLVRASDYWNNHYLFGKESSFRIKTIGTDFYYRLLINGIVPFMFFYGKKRNEQQYCEYAIELLEQVPSERNTILKNWTKFGIKADNAFESQALIYLYNNFCKLKRCLDCQFGNYIIIHGKPP